MAYYTILVINADIVRPLQTVRDVIAGAFGPLARDAGHELNLVTARRSQASGNAPADVSLEFDGTRRPLGHHFFSGGILAEQSGGLAIGSMLEMRVGGPVRRTPLDMQDPRRPAFRRERPPSTSHAETVRNLFVNGERAFARAVGNVCVHELGHTIGGLDHVRDATNFMFTGALIDRVFGPGWRSYDNLRRLWSGQLSFNEQQRTTLVRAMTNRDLLGVQAAPVAPTPGSVP